MPTKRPFGSLQPDTSTHESIAKRRRVELGTSGTNSPVSAKNFAAPSRDFLSSLSDELLLRILSFLPLSNLLGVSPVSRRFHRLSSDSQLWRQLYYLHFVLPRAMRIPGFRPSLSHDGAASSRTVLRYSGVELRKSRAQGGGLFVDWKRQYKLRHNWSRGKCAVEELDVGIDGLGESHSRRKRTLAKVLDGVAITAESAAGLRAWDLKSKKLLAQIDLHDADFASEPACMAVDDQYLDEKRLEIALGFHDGSFGVWVLELAEGKMSKRYRHPKSTNGRLISVAYSFPYLMTATNRVLVSLYAFSETTSADNAAEEIEVPRNPLTLSEMLDASLRKSSEAASSANESKGATGGLEVAAPCLITSLRSHSSKAPLALSIRKTSTSTIASIAYTLPTREGWTIGIQELHVKINRTRLETVPEVFESRLAHAPPVITGRRSARTQPSNPPSEIINSADESDDGNSSANEEVSGPMALCYTHPYLLVTQPDNTLILYLCTTNAAGLSISRGIRLWGHTSGIGDAEITSRGKAVSVSCHGDEIRVWELEGRSGGRSVEIRPSSGDSAQDLLRSSSRDEWDDRRSWVGFDDEMVIVLKEAKSGRETLMVYDFS